MSDKEIVIGLDDSPSGVAALRWAAQQAELTGSRLRAIHVEDWPLVMDVTVVGTAVHDVDQGNPHVSEQRQTAIQKVFDQVDPRPDWVLQFAKGHPGKILTEQSTDAQAVVVGTREHVKLSRILIGSVSHYCLTHAACPVVAVPAPHPKSEE